MRWWRGKGRRREKVRVGMEADIYPRQCVTGSAKSAMMNVLAGINPQCTPPPPSSSAVPPPPCRRYLSRPPRTPFTPSSPPLNDSFSYTLETHLSLARFQLCHPLLCLLPFPFFAILDASSHRCNCNWTHVTVTSCRGFHDKAARIGLFFAELITFLINISIQLPIKKIYRK